MEKTVEETWKRCVEEMGGRACGSDVWARRVGETCKMRCLEKACDKKIVQKYIGRDGVKNRKGE